MVHVELQGSWEESFHLYMSAALTPWPFLNNFNLFLAISKKKKIKNSIYKESRDTPRQRETSASRLGLGGDWLCLSVGFGCSDFGVCLFELFRFISQHTCPEPQVESPARLEAELPLSRNRENGIKIPTSRNSSEFKQKSLHFFCSNTPGPRRNGG